MRRKQILAAAMAAFMSVSLPGQCLAGPSGTVAGVTTEPSALEDNYLEYGELEERIANYNTDYRALYYQMIDTAHPSDMARGLAAEANELMEDARDLKSDDMDAETRILYETYKKTAQQLRKQAQKITNSELPSSIEKTLRQNKKRLLKGSQQMMIGYQKALANLELTNKGVELAKAQAEMTERMAALGMKSQDEILAAKESLKNAENGAATLKAGLQNVKQNLLIFTGWEYDAPIEIMPVPTSDLTRIDAMDPQADLQAAIGANYELQQIRGSSATGSVNRGIKKRNISTSEQQLASTLQNMYAAVLSKKQAYEGALAEFQAAEQTMEMNRRKKSLGMIGELEYLAAEASYLTAKSAKITADLELFAEMENYDWAVKGLVVTSAGGNER